MAQAHPQYKGNDKTLRAYVRYDGNNQIVASSVVLRRSMPKVGKWVEIPISTCCSNTTTPPIL